MQIKVNFLEQTAKSQISRQKSPINQYAVFYQKKQMKPLENAFWIPTKLNSGKQSVDT